MFHKDKLLISLLSEISVALAGNNVNQQGYDSLVSKIEELKSTLENEFSQDDNE